jgi:hypothetical protein
MLNCVWCCSKNPTRFYARAMYRFTEAYDPYVLLAYVAWINYADDHFLPRNFAQGTISYTRHVCL